MSPVVLLVRHAQTRFRPDRLAGWTPGVLLSELGEGQAASVGERLSHVPLVALYSSPLERCMQTAQAIADARGGMDIHVDERIGEVRYGAWQGRSYAALAKTDLWKTVQLTPSQATFPKGESIRDLQHRAVEAIEEIRGRHRRGVITVVSHADTIKVVAAHYLGMHLDHYQRLSILNASVTAIAFGRGFPHVLRVSDTGSYGDFIPPKPKPKKRASR